MVIQHAEKIYKLIIFNLLACLMIFAWLFCVSTGIILARYYKFILPSIKIQKMMFWFQAHRALMIFTQICSLIAFIIILADLNWEWVSLTNKVSFAHSIIGMLVIGLSLIQVIYNLFLKIITKMHITTTTTFTVFNDFYLDLYRNFASWQRRSKKTHI